MSDQIKIWTFQPLSVWDALRAEGTVLVNPELSQTKQDWSDSLEWMRRQMAARLSRYDGHYPWWAWVRPEPSLREWRQQLAGCGEPFYCKIELVLPRADVLPLLSTPWNYVIMRAYLPLSGEAESKITEADSLSDNIDFSPQEPYAAEIAASWERIFQTEAYHDPPHYSSYVQGVFEYLRLENVRKVTIFRVGERVRFLTRKRVLAAT